MHRFKYVSVFLVCFFVGIFTQNVQAALVAKSCIDYPTYNQEFFNKDVIIGGWALNPSGVKSVSVLLNDTVNGQATMGIDRPDVNTVYPGYPNGSKSGYSYSLAYSQLRAGTNKVSIEVLGINGEKQKTDTYVVAKKQLPRLWIDTPGSGHIVQNQDINLGGWALNSNGVKLIRVYINNTLTGNANIGIQRPDVDKAYPNYLNGVDSGFNYIIKNTSLVSGKNVIRVEAEGNNGDRQSMDIYVEKKSLPPALHVDSPANNQTVDKPKLTVNGWAVNNSGIKNVKIYIDDIYKADATLGIARPDVGAIFPMYPQSDTSGFIYEFDTSTIMAGYRKITIEAIGNDGTSQRWVTYITVKKLEAKVWLDEPSPNKVIEEKDTFIGGWALNASGISSIKIYLDSKFVGDATANIQRPDVNQAFPGYINGSSSGFNFVLLNDAVSSGFHKVTVEVQGNDGSKVSSSRDFEKRLLPNLLNVDGPSANLVSNNSDIAVFGWTLNRKGVKAVNIYIDGVLNGQAAIGSQRLDVKAAFPNYANSDSSGFNYLINVDSIAPGIHSVAVESVGNDDSKVLVYKTVEVKKKNPVVYIDQPGAGYTIKGSSVKVSGWALSDSSIKDIKIYMDGTYKGSAAINSSRPDVDAAYPGYRNGKNSGYSYLLDTSALTIGKHQIKVQATGVDGTTVNLQVEVVMFGVVGYVNYPNSFQYYVDRQFNLGGNANWDGTAVTIDQVAYYMKPDNFINHQNGKYMFLKLTYTEGTSIEDLNKVLIGKGILEGKGSVFLQAGKQNNINPIYLVAHALLETGNGTSALANGILVSSVHSVFNAIDSSLLAVEPKKTYNAYGIGAYDSNANLWGSEKAYTQKWFTIEDAIIGGAAWIGSGYISSPTYKQYTLYKMKWNFGTIWHAYATDIAWAYKQTSMIKQLVDQMDNPVLHFEVPAFTN